MPSHTSSAGVGCGGGVRMDPPPDLTSLGDGSKPGAPNPGRLTLSGDL